MSKIKDAKSQLARCINLIQTPEIKSWTEYWLEENTPEYFYNVPASSTGKYHPQYALGPGGLLRHTVAAVRIAKDLSINLEPYRSYPREKKDCILSALILHDTRKHGYPTKSRYSNASHGQDLAQAIRKEKPEKNFPYFIADLVSTHMGRWNTSYNSNKAVAPKPETEAQHFVHLADYLASRKYLPFDFKHIP